MRVRAWLSLAFAAVVLLAGCDNSGRAQNSTDMRVLHAVADAEALDVLVDEDVRTAAIVFGTTGPYSNFAFGAKRLKVRSATNAAVLAETDVTFGPNARYTVAVYGRRAQVATVVLNDDTAVVAAGRFKARFIGLSPEAPLLDLYLTNADLNTVSPNLAGIGYPSISESVELAEGTYSMVLTASGTKDVVFQTTPQAFSQGSRLTFASLPSRGGRLVNVQVMPAGSDASLLRNRLARVKAINAQPGSVPLNFRGDGTLLLSNVPYQGISDYVVTTAGARTLQLEAASAPGTHIATLARELEPARDYTVIAHTSGGAARLVALTDDNSLPLATFTKVRFVNLRSDGVAADVMVDTTTPATGLAAGAASDYHSLASATAHIFKFLSPGTTSVIASVDSTTLDANAVYTVFLFGTASAATARLVRDR